MMINNKRKMYDLQLSNKLGNALQTWPTILEVKRSSYTGPIAIRGLIPGLKMQTHISQSELERSTAIYLEERNCSQQDIIYSEMAAPSMGIERQLNGQLTRNEQGLLLEYGMQNVHLPEAMKKPSTANLTRCRMILETLTDPSDNNDLRDLLDIYEDPVIEFSILSKSIGWANRRMVVWEVRHY